jgi:hypothetical protein
VPPLELAYVYASLGNREETFAWLERAYAQRAPALSQLKTAPAFQHLPATRGSGTSCAACTCRSSDPVIHLYCMSARTVRLDEQSERILEEVRRARGLSVSAAFKQGLVALRDAIHQEGPSREPYEIYAAIDLGPGGYLRAGARRAKAEISRSLRDKTRR